MKIPGRESRLSVRTVEPRYNVPRSMVYIWFRRSCKKSRIEWASFFLVIFAQLCFPVPMPHLLCHGRTKDIWKSVLPARARWYWCFTSDHVGPLRYLLAATPTAVTSPSTYTHAITIRPSLSIDRNFCFGPGLID